MFGISVPSPRRQGAVPPAGPTRGLPHPAAPSIRQLPRRVPGLRLPVSHRTTAGIPTCLRAAPPGFPTSFRAASPPVRAGFPTCLRASPLGIPTPFRAASPPAETKFPTCFRATPPGPPSRRSAGGSLRHFQPAVFSGGPRRGPDRKPQYVVVAFATSSADFVPWAKNLPFGNSREACPYFSRGSGLPPSSSGENRGRSAARSARN